MSVLVFGVFLSGCMTPAVAQLNDDLFETYEVVIGSSQRQTVLTGFLLDGAMADFAVVDIDENGRRRLRVYAFGDGTWASALDVTLGSEVSFVDVANIDGHDRLVTHQRGRLNWFDPESATEHALVAVTSDFEPPPRGGVPHVDVSRDVNGDGRDDLVVPQADGFQVFIQTVEGAFADPVKVGSPSQEGRIYGADGYRYAPWASGRVHEMDYDGDGRNDLVFWNEDHFEVHQQDEHGLFAQAARTFTTDVAFDSDEIASLAAPHEARYRRADHGLSGDLAGRVLHSLTDLNGDGVTDLVVFALGGPSLFKLHWAYEVHFGTRASDGSTVFASEVGAAIRSDGIPFGVEQHDLDPGSQVGVMFTTVNPGFFKIIRIIASALLTRSVPIDLDFYRMEGESYSDKPNARRAIRADVPPGEAGGKAAFFPPVLLGDVNGDGRSDLLVGRSRKRLRVFLGVPGPSLFARRPQKVASALPRDEEYTWLADLNKDGKQDVLMHHPSSTEPHRLMMLVAR